MVANDISEQDGTEPVCFVQSEARLVSPPKVPYLKLSIMISMAHVGGMIEAVNPTENKQPRHVYDFIQEQQHYNTQFMVEYYSQSSLQMDERPIGDSCYDESRSIELVCMI